MDESNYTQNHRRWCKELIQEDIDALESEKSKDAKKYNILDICNSMDSIFTGAFFLHKDVPKETVIERSIRGRSKSRRQRLDEVKKRKKTKTMNCLAITLSTQFQVICAAD